MIVLGLHFGHDAAVAVLRDGYLESYVSRERMCEVKHALGMNYFIINHALREAKIDIEDVDFVALTSTQNCEYIFDDVGYMEVFLDTDSDKHRYGCAIQDRIIRDSFDVRAGMFSNFREMLYNANCEWDRQLRQEVYPNYCHYILDTVPVIANYLHQYGFRKEWLRPRRLKELGRLTYYRQLLGKKETARSRLVCPVVVQLSGRRIPAYMVDHHAGHAAAAYYASKFSSAAIITQDGFGDADPMHSPIGSGMFYLGQERKVIPLCPHFLNAGVIYHAVGRRLGLGHMGAPGKLMGLAAYGKPRFMRREFVGNWYDLSGIANGQSGASKTWLEHCVSTAASLGYDISTLGHSDKVLDPINVDVAASTQRLFEETFLEATRVLHRIVDKLGVAVNGLCLGGGTALNCATNSRLHNESDFETVFVPPHCDDSGLAIGVAQYIYHTVMDYPITPDPYIHLPLPFLGTAHDDGEIPKLYNVEKLRPHDPIATAAKILANGGVIGWFEGRSEVGPRALGHRSILADPRKAINWERVNLIKGREMWRPFAPAVLELDAGDWFSGAPAVTPFMLFNADVHSAQIPAVTHVDGTARVQTVTPASGGLYHLLVEFKHLTAVPVLLNTSLNDRGKPIVETAMQAATLFARSTLDAMFINGVQLVRSK